MRTFNNLNNTARPTLGIPCDPAPSNVCISLNHFQHKTAALAWASDFPQTSQRPTNPKKRSSSWSWQGLYLLQSELWHWWQLASFHSSLSQSPPSPAQGLPITDHIVAPTRWLWAKHWKWLTWACTRASLRRPQNQQTWRLNSDHTRKTPHKLQK